MESCFQDGACSVCRFRLDPWVRKMPWRRKWQPTPVFFPGKFHGQRRVAGYSPWNSDTTERLSTVMSEEVSFQVWVMHSWTHHLLIQALFPCTSLQRVEEGFLCYAVGPCGWFYKEQCLYVNLNQLISPCLPFFLLWNCKLLLGTMSVRPFLFGKEVHVSPFLDST